MSCTAKSAGKAGAKAPAKAAPVKSYLVAIAETTLYRRWINSSSGAQDALDRAISNFDEFGPEDWSIKHNEIDEAEIIRTSSEEVPL